jgi:hypothetical protein
LKAREVAVTLAVALVGVAVIAGVLGLVALTSPIP